MEKKFKISPNGDIFMALKNDKNTVSENVVMSYVYNAIRNWKMVYVYRYVMHHASRADGRVTLLSDHAIPLLECAQTESPSSVFIEGPVGDAVKGIESGIGGQVSFRPGLVTFNATVKANTSSAEDGWQEI